MYKSSSNEKENTLFIFLIVRKIAKDYLRISRFSQ